MQQGPQVHSGMGVALFSLHLPHVACGSVCIGAATPSRGRLPAGVAVKWNSLGMYGPVRRSRKQASAWGAGKLLSRDGGGRLVARRRPQAEPRQEGAPGAMPSCVEVLGTLQPVEEAATRPRPRSATVAPAAAACQSSAGQGRQCRTAPPSCQGPEHKRRSLLRCVRARRPCRPRCARTPWPAARQTLSRASSAAGSTPCCRAR